MSQNDPGTDFAARAVELLQPANFHCAACFSLADQSKARCNHCESERPHDGWPIVEPAEDRWLGHVIADDWLAVQCVGRGTTGSVYRVESPAYTREFAMKIVDLDYPGQRSRQENREAVLREVEVVSSLRNPHIIPVHQLHDIDDRFAAILMDYVDAKTLRRIVVESGPLQPGRAMCIVRQVAVGLHEAHRADVIHRDVKPENVLIEELPNGEDFARLTDFGVAAVSAERSEKPNGFAGTPLWASPEQILGGPLDARSDLYSLGAMLFYLLTGYPPYQGTEPEAVMSAHLTSPAPRLADKGPFSFPRGLERLVGSLLAKKRTSRPDDLLALIEALDEAQQQSAVRIERPMDGPGPVGLEEESETVDVRPETLEESVASKAEVAVDESDQEPEREFQRETVNAFLSPRVFALDSLEERPTAVAVNTDFLLVGNDQGSVHSAERDGSDTLLLEDPRGATITGLAMDFSQNFMLVGNEAGAVYAWEDDWASGWSVFSSGAPVTALAIDDPGRHYAIAREEGGARVYSREKHELVTVIDDNSVCALALSSDGSHVATFSRRDRRAIVRSVETGELIAAMEPVEGRILALHFVGSRLIGVCRLEQRIRLVEMKVFEGRKGKVTLRGMSW